MHNFDVAKGFEDSTIMFCRSCGLSFRLTTWRDKPDKPGRARWEAMTFETPDEKVIPMPPCRIEQHDAGQESESEQGNCEEDESQRRQQLIAEIDKLAGRQMGLVGMHDLKIANISDVERLLTTIKRERGIEL